MIGGPFEYGAEYEPFPFDRDYLNTKIQNWSLDDTVDLNLKLNDSNSDNLTNSSSNTDSNIDRINNEKSDEGEAVEPFSHSIVPSHLSERPPTPPINPTSG